MNLEYLFSVGIICSLFYLSHQECHRNAEEETRFGIVVECTSVTNVTKNISNYMLFYNRYYSEYFSAWDNAYVHLRRRLNVIVKNSNLSLTIQNYVDIELMDKLTFTNCIIDTIDSNAFKGNRITDLALEGNGVRHLNPSAFISTSLRSLSLADNHLANIQKGVFSNATSIKNLNLAHNNIESLEGLTDLTQLEMLDVSQNSKLQSSFLNDLKYTTKINRINVSFCNLDNTPSGFAEWEYLEQIDLSGNNLKALSGDDFPSTLLTLIARKNALTFLNNSWEHLQLTSLDLSNNFLSTHYIPLVNLISLETLNLQNNTIDDSFYQHTLDKLNQLTSVNLNNNKFTKFDCKMFANNINLQKISIAANYIQSIINIEKCPKSLSSLNVSNNQLKSTKLFSQLSGLSVLDLSNNELHTIASDTFRNLTKLFDLRLNENYIKNLPIGCFKELNNLIYLYLQHNFISNLSHGVFSGLRHLGLLNLSYNELKEVDEEVFSALKELRDFDISWNKLKNIDVVRALSHIHHTVDVNLDGNKYSCSILARISKTSDFVYGNTYHELNVNGVKCDDVPEDENASNIIILEDHIKSLSYKLNVVTMILIILLGIKVMFVLSKYMKRYFTFGSTHSVRYRKEDKEPIHLDF